MAKSVDGEEIDRLFDLDYDWGVLVEAKHKVFDNEETIVFSYMKSVYRKYRKGFVNETYHKFRIYFANNPDIYVKVIGDLQELDAKQNLYGNVA